MNNIKEFEDISEENEQDLDENIFSTYSQAVIWGTDWTAETILNQLRKGNIDLNPNFQRREAWNEIKKSKFIESIILGLPIPPIILAQKKDKKGSYIVIDGKQRLLSIRRFCANHNIEDDEKFETLHLKGLEVLKNLNRKNYVNLDDPELLDFKNSFDNQSIRTIVIKNYPNEEFLYTVFLRLNTGSLPLSPQELRQALHPGPFLDFADEYSIESNGLKTILNISKPDYRMRDVELLIRYFAFKYFFPENYHGKLKDFFDLTCKNLNQKWESDRQEIIGEAKKLENAINTTISIFGEKNAFSKFEDNSYTSRFNRALFDIMVYYFSNENIAQSALKQKEAIKEKFEKTIMEKDNFRSSIESSTKNIQNINIRFKIWGEILKETTNLNIDIPQVREKALAE